MTYCPYTSYVSLVMDHKCCFKTKHYTVLWIVYEFKLNSR